MDLELTTICRLCLKSGARKSIFATARCYNSIKISCSEMIACFASFEAQQDDGLPSLICSKCVSKLKSAYSFKKQCEESHNILIKRLKLDENHEVNKIVEETPMQTLENINPISNADGIKLENPSELESDEYRNSILNLNDHNAYEADDLQCDNLENDLPVDTFEKKSIEEEPIRKTKKSKINDKTMEILGIDVNTLKNSNGHFQCDKCPRVFMCKRAFVRHLEKHFGIKSFFCEICQKYFAREWVHMQTHLRPRTKNFHCVYCDKTFDNRSALNAHSKTHSSETPYICDCCGKTYKRLDRLLFHKKIHDARKDYICQYCSKGFIMHKNLITHINYKHTEERRFQCMSCEKQFVTSQCLKIHEKRHLGIKNFSCEHCSKAFVSKSGLVAHMTMHTKDKPHACRICDVKFGRTDHRNRHELSAHGLNLRQKMD